MNELVIMKDQQAVTSSLRVAETFGKNHRDILRAIRNLMIKNPSVKNMFAKSTYVNKQKHEYPMYYMNRDGFTLLTMGFTGKKALQFKLKCIEAFDTMETQIKVGPDLSGLSSNVQWLVKTAQAMAEQERKLSQVDQKVDAIADIVGTNTEN